MLSQTQAKIKLAKVFILGSDDNINNKNIDGFQLFKLTGKVYYAYIMWDYVV